MIRILMMVVVLVLALLGLYEQDAVMHALGMCPGDMNQCGE